MRNTKIAIIGQFLYPNGSASASRVRNFAKGFVENGCEVSVIPTAPLAKNSNNDKQSLEGVRVYSLSKYPGSGFVPQRNSLIRKPLWFIANMLAAIRSRNVVSTLIEDGACDLAIFYGRSWSILSPSLKICRRKGVTTLIDIVELSSQFGGLGGVLSPIYWDWQRMENNISTHFQGVVAISRGLQEYYQKRGCNQTLCVPSIEGWETSAPEYTERNDPDQRIKILYVGALLERDSPSSIESLITGLKENGCNHFEIRIAGKYGETAEGKTIEKNWRGNNQFCSNITFLGRLSDKELANEFSRTDFFLLTRKNSIEEACAFPTRLVEYIKANRPVIVSNVGDIGLYLKDGVSAVFLDETEPVEGVRKILQLSCDKDAKASMTRSAYRVGQESFNRRIQCQRIIDFASGLTK